MPDGTWLFGQYRLDTATRQLRYDDRVRELDPRALAVLECLLRRAERIVPRATLIAEVWPDADTVFDSAVSKVMRRLRTALGDSAGHVLQTIYGEGYRLAVPATLLPPSPAPEPRSNGHAPGAALRAPGAGPNAGTQAMPGASSSRPADTGAAPPAGMDRGPAPPPAWLPWAIAAATTLVALWLAWLLLMPPA